MMHLHAVCQTNGQETHSNGEMALERNITQLSSQQVFIITIKTLFKAGVSTFGNLRPTSDCYKKISKDHFPQIIDKQILT